MNEKMKRYNGNILGNGASKIRRKEKRDILEYMILVLKFEILIFNPNESHMNLVPPPLLDSFLL